MTLEQIIQLGAATVLCTVVIAEQRTMRQTLVELRIMWAAFFERDRIRRDRAKRDSSEQPSQPKQAQRPPRQDDWEGETTDIHELIRLEREKSRRGERAPRKGTHHDEP